jgi:hypothetical protein
MVHYQLARMSAKNSLTMYEQKSTAKALGQCQEESTVVTAM